MEGPVFMSNPPDEDAPLLAPRASSSCAAPAVPGGPPAAAAGDEETARGACAGTDDPTPPSAAVAPEHGDDDEQQQQQQPDGPVFLQAIQAPSRVPIDVDVDEGLVNAFGKSQIDVTVTQTEHKDDGKEANKEKEEQEEQEEPEEAVTASMEWRRHIKSCLHRRDDEQARNLLDTYERLVGGGNRSGSAIRELVLLSGPSGSGKTRLARTLQDPAVQAGGYFMAGKFDKLNLASNAPYTAFAAAFGNFAAAVRSRGDDEFYRVRHSIHAALGGEASVLTRIIPGLEPLCGFSECPFRSATSSSKADPKAQPAKAASTTATVTAIQRFVFVFRTFLRTVATPQRPVVLLLDDIHFADQCSLSLLTSIVTDEHNTGLVVVCTVDDRPDSHPPYLGGKLRDIEDDGTTIQQIVVPNMDAVQVSQMLRQALDLPPPDDSEDVEAERRSGARGGVRYLSDIVMQQTRGNPADVIEFLCWLRESDLLDIDPDTGAWSWDVDEIEMTINTRQVGDFVADKLEQLPTQVKDVLKVSACLGSHLNVQLLEYVLSIDVRPALKEALASGAIQYDAARREYYFEHDGVQSAAYSLIPEGDRELFHLEVGRRMWRKLDEPAVERYLFTLLLQFNMGRRLITRERERVSIAMLCLHAGIKGARSSTFRTAVIYLDLGLSLLDDSSWRQHYDLTLALHNAGAEMHMCISNFERSAQLVEKVLANAKIMADKVQAYATRIYALGAMDRKKEAIEKGFEVLALMGEPMSTSRRANHLECCTVMKMLRGKSDEQLLRMPLMTDKNKQACLQILNLLFLSSLMGYPAYNPCIALRMVKLTMKNGASVFAASSFANYGMYLIAAQHDIENAYRYGALGEKFLDRFEAQEYMPRVRAAFYGCIYPFRNPVKDVIGPLLEGYKVGVQTGDMEGAFLCMNLYFLNALEAGASITQIEREWACFRESMVSSRYTAFLKITMLHLQTLHHLSGKSKDPLASSGEYINFDEALSRAVKDKDTMVYMALSMSRMIMAIHFNDLDLAVRHLGALKHLKQLPPGIKKISAAFYGGLVMIACIRAGRKRRVNRHYSRWIIKIMDYLATQTPHNCLDKLFLLEAEYASAIGKNDVANKKYICAVGMAKNAGFPMYAALGYELWARHLYRVGDRVQSRKHFAEAVALNRDVGIFRKVERLESEMAQLFPDGPDESCRFVAHGGEFASTSKLCCAESAVSQLDSETPSGSSS